MQAVRKALRKNLILSVILTIMLPLGGAMLGVGLALGQPAIWAIGIAFMVCGFYGCPCAWTMAYAPTKSLSRIVSAVVEENLCTVNEIAAQLSLSKRMCVTASICASASTTSRAINGRATRSCSTTTAPPQSVRSRRNAPTAARNLLTRRTIPAARTAALP